MPSASPLDKFGLGLLVAHSESLESHLLTVSQCKAPSQQDAHTARFNMSPLLCRPWPTIEFRLWRADPAPLLTDWVP